MINLYLLKWFVCCIRFFTFHCTGCFTTIYFYKVYIQKSINMLFLKIRNFLSQNMTLASCFTVCRLLLVVPLCNAIILQSWGLAFWYTIFAGFTDCFDGFIARYYNQETSFGAFLDAFVDKVLISSVVLTLLKTVHLTIVFKFLGVLIILKEFVQVVAAIYLLLTRALLTVKPSLYGKINMFCQLCFILFAISSSKFSYSVSLCFAVPIFTALCMSALSYMFLFIKLVN